MCFSSQEYKTSVPSQNYQLKDAWAKTSARNRRTTTINAFATRANTRASCPRSAVIAGARDCAREWASTLEREALAQACGPPEFLGAHGKHSMSPRGVVPLFRFRSYAVHLPCHPAAHSESAVSCLKCADYLCGCPPSNKFILEWHRNDEIEVYLGAPRAVSMGSVRLVCLRPQGLVHHSSRIFMSLCCLLALTPAYRP